MQDQEGIQTCMPDKMAFWVAVVAPFAERSIEKPEVRGSNPVIGKFYNEHFTVNC